MALKVLARAAGVILFPRRGGSGRGWGGRESASGGSEFEVPVGT